MTFSRLYTLLLSLAILPVLILTACADDKPDNLEPVIEMLPASEIARTEAVVSARIHMRGAAPLTYIAFRYGQAGSPDIVKEIDVPAGEVASLRLTGLQPGATYSCCLEAGTSTASLRSESISFTMRPNELPAVSQPVPLSTGPTGIIVEFEIIDDGGEALLSAGCEVANISTGTSRREYLSPDRLEVGVHRIVIGGLEPLSQFAITPFATNSIGESKGTPMNFTTRNSIVLTEPGTLAEVFRGSSVVELDRLVISGDMNGDDFRFLRALVGAPAMPGIPTIESRVCEIDITDVRIVGGGASYDGSRFTEPDKLTTGLLADCSRLRVALLPASATELARDALARCTALEALTIPAAIETLLPSAGCTSLSSIDVSAGNRNFTSADGVLFNRDCTRILWFPLAKTGPYTLPPSVTEIGENAFFGTHITALVIPPSVTTIGRGAFAGSALAEITLPDNQTNISEAMFQNCDMLTTVRLGTGTKYIGNYAFDGTGLTDLYVGAAVPPFVADEAFRNGASSITEACVLHVPVGSKKVYRNHLKWGLFDHVEEFLAQ